MAVKIMPKAKKLELNILFGIKESKRVRAYLLLPVNAKLVNLEVGEEQFATVMFTRAGGKTEKWYLAALRTEYSKQEQYIPFIESKPE